MKKTRTMFYTIYKEVTRILLLSILLIDSAFLYAQSPNTQTTPGAGTQSLNPVPAAYPTGTPVSFVRSWDAMKPMSTETAIFTNTNNREVKKTTQFVDGLGRPLQTVVWQATPSGKDVVSPIVYDAFGREVFKYLPYPATGNDGNFKVNPFNDQKTALQPLFNPNNVSGGENFFCSKTDYEPAPLDRPVKTYAPGNNWVGDGVGVSVQYLVNTNADSVHIWNIGFNAGAVPVNAGIYSAGQLIKTVTVDESGNNVVEFKDREGHIILKKVESSAAHATPYIGWLCTYYVYDDLGDLRSVMQPQAVNYLNANKWAFDATAWNTSTVAKGLCFSYEYDERQRMIIKRVPDAGEVWLVYDKLDRLVMTQDENLRTSGKWLVNVYDGVNRPLRTGLLGDTHDRAYHQNLAGTSTTYPNTSSGFELLTETYYDDYQWITNNSVPLKNALITTNINNTKYFYTPDNNNFPYPQAVTANYQNRNMVTGAKTEVIGSSPAVYLYSANFYDDRGRIIQTQSTNYSSSATVVQDTVTTQYSFTGEVLRVLVAHKKGGTNPQNYRVGTKNEYDAAGRLVQTSKLIGNQLKAGNEVIIAKNLYDELGQLKEKDLGRKRAGLTDTTHTAIPLDILKYDYNVRGWLRGINKDYARNEGSSTSWFGMELCYDYGFTSTQLNGNIAGIRWRSKGDGDQRAYGYTYDMLNRLKGADYNQLNGSIWDKTKTNFTVSGLGYDGNGNIIAMTQMGMQANNITQIDSLNYNYVPNSNKLNYVKDNGPGWNSTLGDFKEINNNTSKDYTYDGNGNLIQDNNKNISSISYNYLNLPSVVSVTGKGTITYTYDAAGNKLKKVTVDNTVAPARTTTTDYVGLFTYVKDTLQFIAIEEGRARTASPNRPDTIYYDYFEKDHLGNVRVVLTDQKSQAVYPAATLEGSITTGSQPNAIYTEKDYYTISSGNVVSTPAGMPTYQNNNGIYNNNPNSITTANSQKVYKLTGTASAATTGLNITLKVMSGDVIDIFGKAYWKQGISGTSTNINLPLSTIVAGLLATPDGFAAAKAATQAGLTAGSNIPAIPGSFLTRTPPQNDPTPMAYVNYVLLDERFQYVSSGFAKVDADGFSEEFHNSLQNISVTKNGYLYVYCSNQSPVDVFFDNLQVVQTRSPLIEETHYYPFGLVMNGISSSALNFDQPDNRDLYNGNELQSREFSDGSGLEAMDFNARMYDQQLGRFWQIDPLSEYMRRWSPYEFCFNNPILYSDPTGKEGSKGSADTIVNNPNPLPTLVLQPGYKYDNGFWSNVLNFAWNGIDYIPFAGSIKQIGVGIYHGSWSEAGLGLLCLGTDFFTGGEGGEGLRLAEKGVEILAEDEVEEIAERELTNSIDNDALKEYDIGHANELYDKSVPGDGLDVHHAPQSKPGGQVIEGYDKETAPAIALKRGEHNKIPTLKGGKTAGSARKQLAKDIKDLRRYTKAPNSSLEKLIELNKKMYPNAFKK
jgi:RHS repeat-associated protein